MRSNAVLKLTDVRYEENQAFVNAFEFVEDVDSEFVHAAKKAKTDPFGCPDPVTEAPVRRAKKRAAASTPKKAKKAKTLVGAKVNKKFKGYRSASGTEYFDGVIKSVEDGMCVIAWEGGEEKEMRESAVQKILVV